VASDKVIQLPCLTTLARNEMTKQSSLSVTCYRKQSKPEPFVVVFVDALKFLEIVT
jgi:spore coat polysaccharide biosynthesis protein SpsF (cytidylyltransferase family)